MSIISELLEIILFFIIAVESILQLFIIIEFSIFRVEISGVTPQGAPRTTYKKLKTIIQKNSLYRTYDYKQARKSPIFLEPIKLPNKFVEVLVEN